MSLHTISPMERLFNQTWNRLVAVRVIARQQAEDEGLWFVAQTAPEAHLQQELRRLHAVIEKEEP